MDGDDLGGLVEQQTPLSLCVMVAGLAEVLVLPDDAFHRGKLPDGPAQGLQLWLGIRGDWNRGAGKISVTHRNTLVLGLVLVQF